MMDKVGWELASGIKSLQNLMEMLVEVVGTTSFQVGGTNPALWFGCRLSPQERDARDCRVGIYLNEPAILVFETTELAWDEESKLVYSTGKMWVHKLALASEDVHFFALSRPRQIEEIRSFVEKSMLTPGELVMT